MNSIVDVLFLRRPAIDYVSPAICESIFSGSSFPIIVLNPLDRLLGPTGFVLGGEGSLHKLSWNNYPGALCYSVYKLVDELDPNGAYQLIAECITDTFYDPDPGTYRISAITPDGETPLSDPVVIPPPPIVIPPDTDPVFSIDLLGLDDVADVSDNANVVAGGIASFAAAYKNGVVYNPPPLVGSGSGFFFAASPNGQWVVGNDNLSGIDHATSFDFATLRDLGVGTFELVGQDVTDDDAVLATGAGGQVLLDATSGALIANIATAFPASQVGIQSTGRTLNNARQVLGASKFLDTPAHSLYRWQAGSITNINPPGLISSPAFNQGRVINASGQALGKYQNSVPEIRFWFNDGVSSVVLPSVILAAVDMNDSGVLVGAADNAGVTSAYRWSATLGLDFLPLFPDITLGAASQAMDINNSGWIVGIMDLQGFLYHDGEIFKLIDLIPALSGWDSIEDAMFINNLKTIVGRGTYLGAPNTWYIITIT